MKDAGFALAVAYTNLLANLTYEGKTVGVYSLQAPNNATAPFYVIIGPWVAQKSNTKTGFGQKGEINLDVVTRSGAGAVSKKPASDIADLITALITPEPGKTGLTVAGFGQVVTIIDGVRDMSQLSTTDTLVRKIITISHHLNQV